MCDVVGRHSQLTIYVGLIYIGYERTVINEVQNAVPIHIRIAHVS